MRAAPKNIWSVAQIVGSQLIELLAAPELWNAYAHCQRIFERNCRISNYSGSFVVILDIYKSDSAHPVVVDPLLNLLLQLRIATRDSSQTLSYGTHLRKCVRHEPLVPKSLIIPMKIREDWINKCVSPLHTFLCLPEGWNHDKFHVKNTPH